MVLSSLPATIHSPQAQPVFDNLPFEEGVELRLHVLGEGESGLSSV